MTAAAIYSRLEAARNTYVERARAAQRLTVPYWLPLGDGENNDTSRRMNPFNGIGPMGTHNLASRLTMSLMPVHDLFFRFAIDEIESSLEQTMALSQQAQQGGLSGEQLEEAQDRLAAQRSALDGVLATLERGVLLDLEAQDSRPEVQELSTHLLVVGNVLVQDTDDGLLCHGLTRYVLRRYPSGKPAEAILCEEIERRELPDSALAYLRDQKAIASEDAPLGDDMVGSNESEKLKVYTHIQWDKKRVRWHQEILGFKMPGTSGNAKVDESPWMPLRMYRMSGTPYSPGYLEAVPLSDLETAEALTQAVTEGALGMSKFLTGRKPSATITEKNLAKAANGSVVTANPDDVFAIQLGLSNSNFVTADNRLAKVEARLSAMFLLPQFRDSERTTKAEVQAVTLQLDQSLAGLYSILAKDFLQPLVRRRLVKMLRKGRIPDMPSIVRPVVNVGVAAIGRATDLERFRQFLTTLFQSVGEQQTLDALNIGEVIRRLGAACSVNTTGLIKSQARLQRERAQASQQAMAMQMAQAGAADPQRLANAAATVQGMATDPPQQEAPPQEAP